MEEEQRFLRRTVIRLRGTMALSLTPEIKAILRDLITDAEERLETLDPPRPRQKAG